MLRVAKHQLKCMPARRQLDTCLGLPRSEMKMVFVLRNCLIWIHGIIDVYEQMVMPTIWKIVTGMSYTHTPQTETTPKRTFDHRAVLRPNEIERSVLGWELSLRKGRGRKDRAQHQPSE